MYNLLCIHCGEEHVHLLHGILKLHSYLQLSQVNLCSFELLVGTWNLPPSFLSQVSLVDSILIVISDQ